MVRNAFLVYVVAGEWAGVVMRVGRRHVGHDGGCNVAGQGQ